MPRRGRRRITVTGVGTPPPLTRELLHPLAMEVLHRWVAKPEADRQPEQDRRDGRSSKKPRPNEP